MVSKVTFYSYLHLCSYFKEFTPEFSKCVRKEEFLKEFLRRFFSNPFSPFHMNPFVNLSTVHLKNRSYILPWINVRNSSRNSTINSAIKFVQKFKKIFFSRYSIHKLLLEYLQQSSSNFSTKIFMDFSKLHLSYHTRKENSNFSNHFYFFRDSIQYF